jgi:hypothetical protein
MDLQLWKLGQPPVRRHGEGNELREYLAEQVANPYDNPIEWWLANERRYPVLSKMALDTLSIPAASTEPERVFSG